METWKRDQLRALKHSRRRYAACVAACGAMQADLFRDARRLLGWDADRMAEHLGVNPVYYTRIDRGLVKATGRHFTRLLRAIERKGCAA